LYVLWCDHVVFVHFPLIKNCTAFLYLQLCSFKPFRGNGQRMCSSLKWLKVKVHIHKNKRIRFKKNNPLFEQ
jgi:hypothetical protein